MNSIRTAVPVIAMSTLVLIRIAGADSLDPLQPYQGPSLKVVDTSTMTGKVMTGYQGWFNCEGDGADLGWTHWSRNRNSPLGPGNVTVDLWPDVSDYSEEELFESEFKLTDGSAAKVFSSYSRRTVLRHFKWMRDYGIDGAFVQRFANGLQNKVMRHHKDVVLANAREGANRQGRSYAVMYDLSGLPAGSLDRVIDDWEMLRSKMKIGEDPAYQTEKGQPLVAIWGVGFSDGRDYTIEECRDLVQAFKKEGCSVMLGVPSFWRDLKRDAIRDPALHEVLKLADIISPWTIGRYRSPAEAERHASQVWQSDLAWCREKELDFLPVVFPGFSWHNLNRDGQINQIPRLKGQFLWSQFIAARQAGAKMVYVAMFDEVDEATAIFKCTNNPPVGADPFITFEGLPSDHYLWLTGEGAKVIRGERKGEETQPAR